MQMSQRLAQRIGNLILIIIVAMFVAPLRPIVQFYRWISGTISARRLRRDAASFPCIVCRTHLGDASIEAAATHWQRRIQNMPAWQVEVMNRIKTRQIVFCTSCGAMHLHVPANRSFVRMSRGTALVEVYWPVNLEGEVILVPFIHDPRGGASANGKMERMTIAEFSVRGGHVLWTLFEQYFTASPCRSGFYLDLNHSDRDSLIRSSIHLNLWRDEATTEFSASGPKGVTYYRVESTSSPESVLTACMTALSLVETEPDPPKMKMPPEVN